MTVSVEIRNLAPISRFVYPRQTNAAAGCKMENLNSHSAFGYTGEYSGDSTQLLYLRARQYAPSMGRFLTRDTWNGDAYRPLSLNKWTYVEANPINLIDPTGQFPIWCKSMTTQLEYENCVRGFYHLSAPKGYQTMPVLEGSPGCWRGPVAYDAPGYLEGASITSNLPIFAITVSKEIVYSFATMEKQYFDVVQFGLSLQIGATLAQYYGLAFNFNNVDTLEATYQDPFGYLTVGAATGFPGIAQLGTGVIGFKSLTNDILGISQYYSISGGVSIVPLPIPFTQASGEIGAGQAFPGNRFSPYILPSGLVNKGRLISDIAWGVDSKAVVPVPAVLVRALGMMLAYEYSRIHDEIYVYSKSN